MKSLRPFAFLSALLVLALAGCSKKKVSDSDRTLALNQMSEAQFAVSLRDWARAEPLVQKASDLIPDEGAYALMLGNVKAKLAKKSDAKKAYERALADYKDAFKASTPKNSQLVIQQIYILVLLQRIDDAKKLLATSLDDNPTDLNLKSFQRDGTIDRMAADAGVRSLQV